MKGIGSSPREYICKVDRRLPEDEQSVWDLIPRNFERSNAASVKYTRCLREGSSDGEVSKEAMNVADRESFLDYCPRVRNFSFSEEFYASHPQIATLANEKGYIPIIDTRELMLEVARDVHSNVLEELSGAVNDPDKMLAGLKNG